MQGRAAVAKIIIGNTGPLTGLSQAVAAHDGCIGVWGMPGSKPGNLWDVTLQNPVYSVHLPLPTPKAIFCL